MLEQGLVKGPVAYGRPDRTRSRIKTLIGRRFHENHTVQGVAALLHRPCPDARPMIALFVALSCCCDGRTEPVSQPLPHPGRPY
ncbi:hypothetical protein WB401_14785 [Streptomyces brasiliscabiei]|uniref:Transposase n=1 Tax=Streptomyces brasiliscabiei TaxID=2736302 RepID=A0ABU8GFB9_9ACTN